MSVDDVATPQDDGAEPRPGSPVQTQPQGRPVLRVDEARRRQLRPWAIVGAATIAIVTGGVALTYTPVFGARTVEVEGEDHLSPSRVERLARVDLGTNVVHLDRSVTEARLEREPWIQEATVEVELPGTIVISVDERSPILVVDDGRVRRLIADDATVLGRAPEGIAMPQLSPTPGSELRPATIRAAAEVVEAMAPALRSSVASIAIDPQAGVTLQIGAEVEVRYGLAEQVTAKAQALRAILRYAEAQDRSLLSIDVSAPAAPTARFVGSTKLTTAPDPSADAATDDRTPPESPSGSPTASP